MGFESTDFMCGTGKCVTGGLFDTSKNETYSRCTGPRYFFFVSRSSRTSEVRFLLSWRFLLIFYRWRAVFVSHLSHQSARAHPLKQQKASKEKKAMGLRNFKTRSLSSANNGRARVSSSSSTNRAPFAFCSGRKSKLYQSAKPHRTTKGLNVFKSERHKNYKEELAAFFFYKSSHQPTT